MCMLSHALLFAPHGLKPSRLSQTRIWSGLPFPPPEDLPTPGIEPPSAASPALAGRFFTT